MDQSKFVQLLKNVLESDTAKVKEATSVLKKEYYTKPESLAILLQLLTSDESPQLRQLAATQARSLIPKHWGAVPKAHKPQIRSHLLSCTFDEENSLVRHAESRVISAIAEIDAFSGEWVELPQLVMQAAVSPSVPEREVSSYILFTIAETPTWTDMLHWVKLYEILKKTIEDPASMEVRINAMLTISKMALEVDTEDEKEKLVAIQSFFPRMMTVLKDALTGNDEQRTMQAFEVFQTILECDSALLGSHFTNVVQFMGHIATGDGLNRDARTQAMNFLMTVIMYRRLKFQGLRIGDRLTTQLLKILADVSESNDEDDEFSLSLATLSLLSVMSSNLPPSQIMIPLTREFKLRATSADPRQKVAVISALGACVEGAPDFLDSQLKDLLPGIIALLNDPSPKVREAACSGTKLLADHLAETMAQEHDAFMKALGRNLTSAMQELQQGNNSKTNISIVVHCCSAIDSLFAGLEERDVYAYLPDLVPAFSRLFSHPEFKIKSAAIGAVGSIAQCAKSAFVPYFQNTMNALSGYVNLKGGEEELDLRAITIDTMGNIAVAVGPGAFQPYVQDLMAVTEEGLNLGNSQLKETSYMFWGTLARVYEDQFEPYLEGTLKALTVCLSQVEEADLTIEGGQETSNLLGQEVVIAGRRVKVVPKDQGNSVPTEDLEDAVDDNDSDGDDDDDSWDDLAEISLAAEEKEIALEALAEIIFATKEKFLPYFDKTFEMILVLLDHPYEATKRAAISTLFRAYATRFEMQAKKTGKWSAGLPLQVPLDVSIVDLGHRLMGPISGLWGHDEDSGVITEINSNIAETLKMCGPSLLSEENIFKEATRNLIDIMSKKHIAQQEADEDAPFEDDEASEDDWLLIESAFDALTAIAAALGPQFAKLWKEFEKLLQGYASGTEATQRSAAVGAIADVIRGMQEGVTPFTGDLLQLLLHRLSDEDPLTKSNAAFAMGLLVEHSEDHNTIVKAYNTILSKLEPLLEASTARQPDNAAGCVSRMIAKHRESVPLNEVLPALISLLPLREDFEENEPVYRMILGLYAQKQPLIERLTPQFLAGLSEALKNEPAGQLLEDTRRELCHLVKYIQDREPDLVAHNPVLMEAAQSV